jgi:hypothetical protein
VIERKTQTAEYWQGFELTRADTEFLRNLLLDAERPLTTRELALALVTERCRHEEADLRAELSRGAIYQPKKRFALGDKVIFPALEFRLGEVVDLRAGQNPEHGEFDVITVDFGPNRRQRSFAAGLSGQHKLNAEVSDILVAGNRISPEKLLATSAGGVPALLGAQLGAQPDFATFEDRWLHRDLLAEIHVGHLNIAEAVIEMRGMPVETKTLIKELDLPAEIKPDVLAFSLQSALSADGRFDQVGPGDVRQWYLCRLEPVEALSVPEALRYQPIRVDPGHVPADLLQCAVELDDEWSDQALSDGAGARVGLTTTTLLLTYPHLVAGTLPLNRHANLFFPKGHGERTAVTLIDGRWGNRFQGWVNHAGRYVAGLRPWFEKHKLPAGAYITLERRDDSGEIVVDFRPKRMRREWTRFAQLADGNRLDIQLRKQEVACEYDELLIIGDDRNEDILKLRSTPVYAQTSLDDLVFEVFTDLAGLSQSGSVHAKTIYSAVNVLRRCPPEPVFAALADHPKLEAAGGGTFRLAI